MTPRRERRLRWALTLRAFLSRHGTRVFLSILILLSLCPFPFVDRLWWVFFAIFGFELFARLYVLRYLPDEESEARRPAVEIGLIALDLIAWLSFLPLAEITGFRFLRLVRFVRLGMLFGYWGETLRLLWSLLNRTERTRQLKLLGLGVVGMVFVSAAIMAELAKKTDTEALGIDGRASFLDYVWWSYRQLEDPGNLISDADRFGIAALSFALTLGGIILLSFIVGICSSVVSDLLAASRERSLGYRGHSILINAGERAPFFLEQLVEYSKKQLARPGWMVMGERQDDFELLSNPVYRGIEYRHGSPYHSDDLAKVDASTASRIVVLADSALAEPDPETISAVLSIRQINDRARFFAEVHDEGNASALLAAGGAELTTVVATDHLIAVVLANLLAIPENDRILDELLTAKGCEIYSTCETEDPNCQPIGQMQHFRDFGSALSRAYEANGCVLLGLSVTEPSTTQRRSLRHQLNPQSPSGDENVLGLLGLARTRSDLIEAVEEAAHSLQSTHSEAPSDDPTPVLELKTESESDSTTDRSPTILICGFRNRTSLLVEHLIRFFPRATVFIMVPDERSGRDVPLRLVDSAIGLDEYGDTDIYDPGLRGQFVGEQNGDITYRFPESGETGGTIRVIVGDWSSRADLLRQRDDGFDLFDVDEILLQSGTVESGDTGGDPDAKTVLTLLKLENLRSHPLYGDRFKKSLRLVAEMVDPLKAKLIERRFGSFGRGSHLPVAVINTEWLRHVLMFQATVVPNFSGVFLELFSYFGQSLRRLATSEFEGRRAGSITFGRLLKQIYDRHHMILIGVEVDVDGSREVLLAPRPTGLESKLTLADITAVYVVGSQESA